MNGNNDTAEPEGRHASDWLAGVSADEAAQLAALRTRYPRWSAWKGRHTGKFWGCPPGPGDLIGAGTVEELAARIAAAEGCRELS